MPPLRSLVTSDKPRPLKRSQRFKNDNSRPTQHLDHLTTATKMRQGRNSLQTTTSTHENHPCSPMSTSPIAKRKASDATPRNNAPWTRTDDGQQRRVNNNGQRTTTDDNEMDKDDEATSSPTTMNGEESAAHHLLCRIQCPPVRSPFLTARAPSPFPCFLQLPPSPLVITTPSLSLSYHHSLSPPLLVTIPSPSLTCHHSLPLPYFSQLPSLISHHSPP